MDRVNRILVHPLWIKNIEALTHLEQDRIFCKHGVEHLLDVARLAYIDSLEHHFSISKELIYAAALLHDIGRAEQYIIGTPHHEAGARIAADILKDCEFSEPEQALILDAIHSHRSTETKMQNDLSGILYRADKGSRMCLFCHAQSDCNWSDEKKNLILKA